MYTNTDFPRPIKLTFYFFFITHMLKEGSPSVQDSFILHPIVIKKKKRMLRLLLEGATGRSPASGQVNLQAAAHVNRAESLFLWCDPQSGLLVSFGELLFLKKGFDLDQVSFFPFTSLTSLFVCVCVCVCASI